MLTKIMVAFAVLALAVSFAGTVPGARTDFKIMLLQPATINGMDLQAGECRLSLGDAKVTVIQGKQSVVVPAKIEDAEKKFDATAIRYKTEGTKQIIGEIRLGGTKTRITVIQ